MKGPTPLAVDQRLTSDQQRLVTEHKHVVKRVLRRYGRALSPLVSWEDMEQSAQLGLIYAARVYRRDDGAPFAGFAWSHCFGAVLRAAEREKAQRNVATSLVKCMMLIRRHGNVLTHTAESALEELRAHAEDAMLAIVLGASAEAPARADEAAIAAELARGIRACVAALSEEQRRLIELHYFDGRELKSVAEELDVSYATARRRHNDALKLLAPRLRAQGIVSEAGASEAEG